jgi:hypothetical protein
LQKISVLVPDSVNDFSASAKKKEAAHKKSVVVLCDCRQQQRYIYIALDTTFFGMANNNVPSGFEPLGFLRYLFSQWLSHKPQPRAQREQTQAYQTESSLQSMRRTTRLPQREQYGEQQEHLARQQYAQSVRDTSSSLREPSPSSSYERTSSHKSVARKAWKTGSGSKKSKSSHTHSKSSSRTRAAAYYYY